MTGACAPVAAVLPESGRAALSRLLPRPLPHSPAGVTLVSESRKSVVYRTRMVDGTTYILKRHPITRAEAEARIYRDVLDPLGLPSPRCFGTFAEPAARDHAWLVMGDAGDERAQPGSVTDGRVAAQWLAAAHLATAGDPPTAVLEARHAAFYAEALDRGLERLAAAASSPHRPSATAQRVLESLYSGLTRVQARWEVVPDVCASAPIVLAHGDFVPKNLAMARAPRPTLLPLDWEVAGAGPPATDIAELTQAWPRALDVYASLVAPAWPALRGSLLTALVGVGRVWRVILATDWATEGLMSRGESNITGRLGTYVQWLDAALAEPPWR
jgi:aminoglycoside phosphotransferase (APT) family kinase protein